MITGLIAIWTVIFGLYYLFRKWYIEPKTRRIPGPPGIPIVGNALLLWGKPQVVFRKLYELSSIYTRIMAVWIGPKLHVAVFDPRDAEVILRASRHQVQKADEYRFLKPWLGESLLISTGAKFKSHKKLILPAFNMSVLKEFIETFNVHSRKMVVNLKKEIGNLEFDIHDYLSTEAMNVFLETSLGVNNETLGDDALKYARAVEKLCKIVHMRTYSIWLRPDFLFKFSNMKKKQDECLNIVHPLTERVIKHRREEFIQSQQHQSETGETERRRKAILLDLLIEASLHDDGLTDQEIKDEVLTMMFAGQDTTSGTTGFALSLLGLYRRIQYKVHAELDEIFGDSDRDVTYEDICRMEYTERVILETLRLYPAIPMVAKKPIQDLHLEGGYVLPRSCSVGIIIMQIHRNPNYYENPNIFNPDNFLPERVKARHPYCYLPFSAGARTCVGPKYAMLKMKVVLAQILRSYKVYSTRNEKDFILSAQTTLKRCEGFLLRIEPRQSKLATNSVQETISPKNETITDHIIKTVEKCSDDVVPHQTELNGDVKSTLRVR